MASASGKTSGSTSPSRLRLPQGLEGQVRVDPVGPVARQQAMVMHFARLATFQQDTDARALGLAHQVMMHRTAGQQRTHGHAVPGNAAVGQHDQAKAVVDGLFRLGADALQRRGESTGNAGALVGDVDGLGPPPTMVHGLQLCHVFVGQNRMPQAQTVRIGCLRLKQVALRAHVALQGHDDFFPDGVDGRVGDLCKQLFEVVVDHARPITETGQRGIVTHGSNRIAQFADQRQQHELHGLAGIAKGAHARQQFAFCQPGRRLHRLEIGQRDALGFQPLTVRATRGEFLLQVIVGDQLALFKIDQEHAPWLEPALELHDWRDLPGSRPPRWP